MAWLDIPALKRVGYPKKFGGDDSMQVPNHLGESLVEQIFESRFRHSADTSLQT